MPPDPIKNSAATAVTKLTPPPVKYPSTAAGINLLMPIAAPIFSPAQADPNPVITFLDIDPESMPPALRALDLNRFEFLATIYHKPGSIWT